MTSAALRATVLRRRVLNVPSFHSRGGREDNIGLLAVSVMKSSWTNEQFGFTTSIAKSPEMRERIAPTT